MKVYVQLKERRGLEAAVASKSARVRLAAIEALALESNADNVPPFLRALEDQDPTVRDRAAELLSSYAYVTGVEVALRRSRKR